LTGCKQRAISGVIRSIDAQSATATISIGSEDGVSRAMKFRVTRDNEFVCELIVTDVEKNESSGVMELIQTTPQVGDLASAAN
jgi:hypothetical protein